MEYSRAYVAAICLQIRTVRFFGTKPLIFLAAGFFVLGHPFEPRATSTSRRPRPTPPGQGAHGAGREGRAKAQPSRIDKRSSSRTTTAALSAGPRPYGSPSIHTGLGVLTTYVAFHAPSAGHRKPPDSRFSVTLAVRCAGLSPVIVSVADAVP